MAGGIVETLLEQARKAGLSVSTDGSELYVRGPLGAGGVIERLRANKGAVIAALRGRGPAAKPATSQRRPAPTEYKTTMQLENEAAWKWINSG